MTNQTQYYREEQQLEDNLADGRITQAEYNKEMRALQADYRAAADEACQDAAERERGNW
ncbi:MAG: hypothetical protein JJD98_00025 [Polaromonas sp.]|nr:hypothetical protein [Polaromonas sp.]